MYRFELIFIYYVYMKRTVFFSSFSVSCLSYSFSISSLSTISRRGEISLKYNVSVYPPNLVYLKSVYSRYPYVYSVGLGCFPPINSVTLGTGTDHVLLIFSNEALHVFLFINVHCLTISVNKTY